MSDFSDEGWGGDGFDPDDDDREPIGFSSRIDQIVMLLRVGQTHRALDLAMALVAEDPDDGDNHLLLAQVLSASEMPQEALHHVDEAIARDADNEDAWSVRAQICFDLGRVAEAERDVRRAIEINPEDEDSYELYARLLYIFDKSQAALRLVEHALTLAPDEASLHELRSQILLEVHPKEAELSEQAALQALRLDPEQTDAHAALGIVRLRQGRHDEAEACFRDALTLDPAHGLALHGLAEVVMAKSWAYRPLLAYSLWMSRSSIGTQLAVVGCAWALVTAITGAMRPYPDLDGLRSALSNIYLVFCLYTWFARPVTRWLLGRKIPWLRELDDA